MWPPPVERPLVLQVPLGPLSRDDATDARARHPRAGRRRAHRARRSPTSSPAAAATRCSSSSWRAWRRRAPADDLPGLAAGAHRGTHRPAAGAAAGHRRQRRGARHGRLHRRARCASPRRWARSSAQRDLDELAADGLLDVDGKWWRFRSAVVREVAYQTLTKRVRAQRHAGIAAVMAERGSSIDDVAHHAATAAELLAELGTVDGVKPVDHGPRHRRRCARRRRPRSRPAATSPRCATPAGRSTCTRRTPRVERWLLLIRAEAELERRNFAAGHGRRRGGARRRAGRGRRDPGGRGPPPARLASPRCRAISRRRGASSAPPSTCSARPATRSAWPARCAPRGFAEVFGGSLDDARWLLGEAMEIYHRIDDERGHAWTHQNLAWVSFSGGAFDEAEVQLERGQAALPRPRRRQRRAVGRRPPGVRLLLPAPLRRGRGAGDVGRG